MVGFAFQWKTEEGCLAIIVLMKSKGFSFYPRNLLPLARGTEVKLRESRRRWAPALKSSISYLKLCLHPHNRGMRF